MQKFIKLTRLADPKMGRWADALDEEIGTVRINTESIVSISSLTERGRRDQTWVSLTSGSSYFVAETADEIEALMIL